MTNDNFRKVKTKILSNESGLAFEASINEFIKDKIVLDIQYRPFTLPLSTGYKLTGDNFKTKSIIVDRALIIYVDEEGK